MSSLRIYDNTSVGRGAHSYARMPKSYYGALQIMIADGDQVRAKVFAERAYAERALLEGEENTDLRRLKYFH
jgi:hypothetical protein